MDKDYLKRILADEQQLFTNNINYLKRDVDIKTHSRSTDISVITGVRRCGKSTLLKQIVDCSPETQWFYIDLESPRLATFTSDDFDLCDQIWRERIDQSSSRVIAVVIDEVQNVEGWERWIRYFSEKRRYKVFVTGSNSEMLSSELGTALGGRYITLELFPFSFKEVAVHLLGDPANWQDRTELHPQINTILEQGFDFGLFPKPFLERSKALYPHLFQDIVTRDIVKRKRIRKSVQLIELGLLLARDNTRLLNAAATSKLIELDDSRTLTKYLTYFEDAYLFFRLRSYSRSRRKQLRGGSKSYCIDSVLADEVSAQRQRVTNALENMVHLELRRHRKTFGFWISSNGYEVDFIVENQYGGLSAIQACYDLSSPETISREVRALLAAQRELKITELIVVTRDFVQRRTRELIPDKIKIISLAQFLGVIRQE